MSSKPPGPGFEVDTVGTQFAMTKSSKPTIKKLQPGDPDTQSTDVIAENIAKLKSLFPEIVTEGEKGASVNVDVLKQLVGDATVTDCDEKFGLNWHGKRRARQLALTPSTGTLRPCPEESVDWETTQNLFIEGDNLEVLKLLQKSYAGKVKLIYIDPPYNTGNDFIYPDNFSDRIQTYFEVTGQAGDGQKLASNPEASGRFHTNWLNMMMPRLKVARNLLRDDGVIAVSIDHHEVAHLRCALADIFGDENYINTLVWVNNLKGRQISAHGAALTHEFVVIFAKNQDLVEEFDVQVEWARSLMPSAYKGFKYEVLKDSKGEYVLKNQLYNTNSTFNEETRPNLVFNIHYNPSTEEVKTTAIDDDQRYEGFEIIRPHRSSDGKHKYHAWRWSRSKVEEEADDLAFVANGKEWRVFTKVRGFAATVLKDLVTDISTNGGSNDVKEVLGECPFTYPKPLSLMRVLVQAVTHGDEDAFIMDFFAGSGTTAHAVMVENALFGTHRRYCLVQLPEALDPKDSNQKAASKFCDRIGKPRTIAELAKERLRRSADKVREDCPMLSGDLGFRVFKLDSSNIREWEPSREDIAESLEAHVKNLRTGRTDEDILYELLLKRGLDLCVPIETKEIAGKTVHSIGAGTLFACLSKSITAAEGEPLALGIVEWHKELDPAGDTTIVFRDSAFADDVVKTNVAEILNQSGLKNVRSL